MDNTRFELEDELGLDPFKGATTASEIHNRIRELAISRNCEYFGYATLDAMLAALREAGASNIECSLVTDMVRQAATGSVAMLQIEQVLNMRDCNKKEA